MDGSPVRFSWWEPWHCVKGGIELAARMPTTGAVSVAGNGRANVVSNCVVLLTQLPRRVGAERELTLGKQ